MKNRDKLYLIDLLQELKGEKKAFSMTFKKTYYLRNGSGGRQGS